MLPPRPSRQMAEDQNQERIGKAYAAMKGEPQGSEEPEALSELEAGLQQATAALEKLKGAEQQEDAGAESPAAQGMP